jgi:hypothetical protein
MVMEAIPTLPIAAKYASGLKEQMSIGALNFLQGKVSRRLARDICGKSCPTKHASSYFEARLAIKSIWLAASKIWRARNDAKHGKTEAEKRLMKKNQLDQDIAIMLRSLHRKRIRYPPVPRGRKYSIPAKTMWLRLSRLQLDRNETSLHRFRQLLHRTPHTTPPDPTNLQPD